MVTISSQFWRLEPPFLLSFGVQSHNLFSVWAFRATISFQFGVRSNHIFSVWSSEPPSLLGYGVQSHHLFTTRHSKPPYLFSYDIQSCPSQFDIQRCQFSIMAFRVFIFFNLAFRAIPSQSGCSEPPFLFSLAFRVTIPS